MSRIFAVTACVLLTFTISAAEKRKPNPNQVYADLHKELERPENAGWRAAMQKLASEGDAFSVDWLNDFDVSNWTDYNKKIFNETVAAIKARLAKDDDKNFSARVKMLLERAAYVDIRCDPLETALVSWTTEHVLKHVSEPGVKEELEKIKAARADSDKQDDFASAIQERMALYAAGILKGKSDGAR